MSLAALALGAAAGLALGWLYFVGLWWTVQRVPHARRAGALLMVSFLLRAAVTVAGLLLVLRLGPAALVAALVGFVAARWLATRGAVPGPRRRATPDAGSEAKTPGGER
jgi:F1F0 ATPase subunit 2